MSTNMISIRSEVIGNKAIAGLLRRAARLPSNRLTHSEYRDMRKIHKGWDDQWGNWDNTFSPEWGDVSG